ncbi:hypothetical protein AAG906_020897 [Vitis piasezkii]
MGGGVGEVATFGATTATGAGVTCGGMHDEMVFGAESRLRKNRELQNLIGEKHIDKLSPYLSDHHFSPSWFVIHLTVAIWCGLATLGFHGLGKGGDGGRWTVVMRERYIAVWVRQHGYDGYEMSGVRLKKSWVCKVEEGMELAVMKVQWDQAGLA